METAQPGETSETSGPSQNEPPHSTPGALFSRFPLLPAEIQIQIWEEAASPRRVVFLAPETASARSEEALTQPNAVQAGRVPALLHAARQSRQACLPIYKNRLQVRSPLNNLWETYILADHDVMALSVAGLLELVDNCRQRDVDLDSVHALEEQDGDTWRQLLGVMSSSMEVAPLELLTPRIVEHLKTGLLPADISSFRGDLGSIQRLVLYNTPADETWPGLYRDPAVLANLDRAYPHPLVVDCAQNFDRYLEQLQYAPQLLAEAGIPDLPERYHCRPLGCPLHPELCDRQQPAIGITRTTLNLGRWLAWLAALHQNQGAAESPLLSSALAQNWARDGHDMVMWCFSEPRYGAVRLPSDAPELARLCEAYFGLIQTDMWGLAWRSATVYDWHGAPSQPCPRGKRVCKSGGPQASRPVPTPGCWRCEHPGPS